MVEVCIGVFGSSVCGLVANVVEKIRTAEGITRFLRSKNTSIQDIVKVSNELLDEKLDVYLPNKGIFVFELLCDRLNDVKTKNFRLEPEIWELFNKTYIKLDAQPKVRNRTFQGLKFGEALASSLNESQSSKELLLVLTRVINLVKFNTISNNTFDFSVEILTKYLELVTKLSDELDDNETQAFIKDITSLFQVIISTEKLSKKFISNFASTALPSILKLSDVRKTEFPSLLSLIKRILLNKEQQENLISNLELLIKAGPSDAEIAHYYRMVIDSISKSDIQTAEKLFTIITEKYPNTSEQLLGYLSAIKRTLSQAFLDQVVEKEFSYPKQNWNLLNSVLELDIEIGIKHALRIMRNLESQDFNEYLKIGEQLVNCFIRAREFVNFFNLWCQIITDKNSKWSTKEFKEIVSNNIHVLSFSQLTTLVNLLLSSDRVTVAQLVLLNTIVQGLFRTQDALLVQQSRELFIPVWELKQDNDELWCLKYQLLCLYEDILNDEQLENVIFQSKFPKSTHHFYTVFRIREIHEFDIASFASSFVKFSQRSGSFEIFKTVFTRWFVMINEFFNIEQINSLVDLLLADPNFNLDSIFGNDLLFEQPKITESLISKVSASLNKKSDKLLKIEILKTIPIQCYPKKLKTIILDQLVDELLQSKESHDEILEAIQHILQTPTFKSKIESDLSTIFSIVDKSPKSKVFPQIWSHYITSVKETSSQDYIKAMIQEVTSSISKFKNNKLSSSHYIAFTILSNPPNIEESRLGKLKAAFVESSKTLLNSFIGSKESQSKIFEISWLLNVLYLLDLSEDDFYKLQPSIKKFAQNLNESKIEIKENIFLLYSKYSNTGSFTTEYFEALYIVLRSNGVPSGKLLVGLGNVVSKLSEDEFHQSFNLLIESFNDESNVLYLVEILSVYWKYFQRESTNSSKLFVKSLSTALINFSKFSKSQALNNIILSSKSILLEKSWIISQYSLELLITLLSKSADSLLLHNNEYSESIYLSITLTLSNILLFHRFRLSNRHHIILSLFKSLLSCLTKRNNGMLSTSISSAEAYSRVVSNLCEPSQHSFKDSNNDSSLNSASSIVKKSLRKHLPILLLSYIYFALKYSYDTKVREALLPGIFNIFDVLSQNELVLVSSSLDYSGRTYYRSLYDDYKKIGKWKTD